LIFLKLYARLNFDPVIHHLEVIDLKNIPKITDMNETVSIQKELLEKIKEKIESIGKQVERLYKLTKA
jgi:hypothetical protein